MQNEYLEYLCGYSFTSFGNNYFKYIGIQAIFCKVVNVVY